MLYALKPKGMRIFYKPPYRKYGADGFYFSIIKSNGRNGAAVRARFMSLSDYERQKALAAWWKGDIYDFPRSKRS